MHKTLIIALVFACAATSADARRHHSRHNHYRYSVAVPVSVPADDPIRAGRYGQRRARYDRPAEAVEPIRTEGYSPRRSRDERPAQTQGNRTIVPPDWRLEPSDPNWKGYRYQSPGGDAAVVFYTSPIAEEPVDEHWKGFAFRSDEDLRYLERGLDWVVASGLAGPRGFYRKAALDCHERVWRHAELEFPAGAKSSFDPLIARMAHTLDFGSTNTCIGDARN